MDIIIITKHMLLGYHPVRNMRWNTGRLLISVWSIRGRSFDYHGNKDAVRKVWITEY